MFQILVETVLVEVADRQVGIGIQDDAILVDLLNLLQVDNIRAMDTHEKGGGQIVLHLFHTEQGDDGLLTL